MLSESWRQRISAYHDAPYSGLTASEVAETEAFLGEFEAGRDYLRALDKLDHALGTLPSIEASDELRASFWRRMHSVREQFQAEAGRVIRLHRRKAVVAAAACLAVAVGLGLILSGTFSAGGDGGNEITANSDEGEDVLDGASVPDAGPEPDAEMLSVLDLLTSQYDLKALAAAELDQDDLELVVDTDYSDALDRYDQQVRSDGDGSPGGD